MAKITYKKSSPYAATAQASWYLSILEYRPIPRDPTDKIIVVQSKYNNRPDLLSYDLYGTPDYWWTFMILNPDQLKDPIYDLVTGMSVYVAAGDRLVRAVGA